jgi:hypothetical protein
MSDADMNAVVRASSRQQCRMVEEKVAGRTIIDGGAAVKTLMLGI